MGHAAVDAFDKSTDSECVGRELDVAIDRAGDVRSDDLFRRVTLRFTMVGSEQLGCKREDGPRPGDGDAMPRKHGLQA